MDNQSLAGEGEKLEDRRNVGANSCNSGDGADQKFKSLMFMMMMITRRFKILFGLGAVKEFSLRLFPYYPANHFTLIPCSSIIRGC